MVRMNNNLFISNSNKYFDVSQNFLILLLNKAPRDFNLNLRYSTRIVEAYRERLVVQLKGMHLSLLRYNYLKQS